MRIVPLLSLGLFLLSCNSQPKPAPESQASAWALVPFEKVDSVNPVLSADSTLVFTCPVLKRPVKWAEKDVFNPATVVRGDTLFLLFRAEDRIGKYAGTSRIGLAWSTDGLHFTSFPEPVLYPAEDAYKKLEWEGGCEDPRVVQDETGTYYLTYTAYDGDKARLLVASSPDLRHWTKHGPAFRAAYGGRYENFWSKSGAIVSRYEGSNCTATRIGGKYWMYWGDQNIWAATSDDLIRWTPVVDSAQQLSEMEQRGIARQAPELKVVFGPRRGKFDSDLVEPGPPALLTNRGIVLLYNSRNVPTLGDTTLPEGTYAAAQILMDPRDPTKVLDRTANYFMRPDKPYETTGQVNHVCFVEGLAHYRGRWHLYYGTADSKIAVAVKEAPSP
jgi:beta-1,2-mannosidase